MSKDWCPTAKAIKHPDRISAEIALADATRKRQNVSHVEKCRRCGCWHVK